MDKMNQSLSKVCCDNQDVWHSIDLLHHDLIATKSLVYNLSNFECSQPLKEAESAEYAAYTFQLNGLSIRFRVAKITPTKTGQFVTLWKRMGSGPIQPYDNSDPIDLIVISVRKDNNFGQFVFPKSVLCKHDVMSIDGKGGKRAIRVYPPWEKNLNRQAQKTQEWQVEYFLNISQSSTVSGRAHMLYSLA